MAIQQEQIFTVIVIQWDDTIFEALYTSQPNGQLATIKIRKILDTSWYITINMVNNSISWNGHFPLANKITLNKGLTIMEVG